jgi:predicted RNase H-like HicB family nuclease
MEINEEYIEKYDENCGLIKINLEGEVIYSIYYEADKQRYFSDLPDFLGRAISKGKTPEEAMKKAIINLSQRLEKHIQLCRKMHDISEEYDRKSMYFEDSGIELKCEQSGDYYNANVWETEGTPVLSLYP